MSNIFVGYEQHITFSQTGYFGTIIFLSFFSFLIFLWLRQLSPFHSGYPTDPVTISEAQNPSIDALYGIRKRRLTEIEALKL